MLHGKQLFGLLGKIRPLLRTKDIVRVTEIDLRNFKLFVRRSVSGSKQETSAHDWLEKCLAFLSGLFLH